MEQKDGIISNIIYKKKPIATKSTDGVYFIRIYKTNRDEIVIVTIYNTLTAIEATFSPDTSIKLKYRSTYFPRCFSIPSRSNDSIPIKTQKYKCFLANHNYENEHSKKCRDINDG